MTDPTKAATDELFAGGETSARQARKNKPAAPAPADGSILSEEEKAELREEAARLLREDRRKAEAAKFLEEEKYRLKREEGQRTGQPDKDEVVRVVVDLAEFADRIVINGVTYFHGSSYDVPRHIADSMRETMQRTHRHQMTIDGKSLEEAYRRTAPKALSPAGVADYSEAA